MPVSVIVNKPDMLAEIEKVATQYETKEIVLGESRDYKGQPNEILLRSTELKKLLEAHGFIVHWEAEFMTSMHAEKLQGKHDLIDASAAALILQSYLDRHRKAEPDTEPDLGDME